ncbi:hypothetical protein BDV36DRAFT_295244 [Aspergillus pseudocaelatus]|uniref:Uncharacterized protein n=1 Tax=Aspergillus pseudocaelatus TaxID=1825620 RepID=A0ABQ6WMR7_9EURO|nr:hypothetical protein BDV36DRAFT_295244 [Aspergillus pseudocaelatus]
MKEARKIHELQRMFDKYDSLINRVDGESNATVQKLKNVRNIFSPLGRKGPIRPTEKWMAQIRWYRKGNKTILPLFQDMNVLEQSMRTIGILVQIHILTRIHPDAPSNAILAHTKWLEKMLSIEIDKLRRAQRSQEKLLTQHMVAPRHDAELDDFAQDILRLLEKEIPRLFMNKPPGSPPTSDSRSPPSSPNAYQRSPITPPSSPPCPNGGNRGSAVRLQPKEMLSPSLEGPRRSVRQTRDPPLSTTTRSLRGVEVDAQEEVPDDKDSKEQTGPYMPMPPFGLPTLAPRPRAGRTWDSGDDFIQSESRPPPTASRSSLQRNGGPSSSQANRQNGSIISVYGNDGEVTPTHLTGGLGLQSGLLQLSRPLVVAAATIMATPMGLPCLRRMADRFSPTQLPAAALHAHGALARPSISPADAFLRGSSFSFNCVSDFGGMPDHCAVLDVNGNELSSADGNSNFNFIGIAIAQDGFCGTSFELPEGADCQPGVTGIKATLNPQPMRGEPAEYDPVGGIPREERGYTKETEQKMAQF